MPEAEEGIAAYGGRWMLSEPLAQPFRPWKILPIQGHTDDEYLQLGRVVAGERRRKIGPVRRRKSTVSHRS